MSCVLCHTHGSENLGVEAQVPIIIRKTDDDCHCFLKSVTWSPSGMLSCDGCDRDEVGVGQVISKSMEAIGFV